MMPINEETPEESVFLKAEFECIKFGDLIKIRN